MKKAILGIFLLLLSGALFGQTLINVSYVNGVQQITRTLANQPGATIGLNFTGTTHAPSGEQLYIACSVPAATSAHFYLGGALICTGQTCDVGGLNLTGILEVTPVFDLTSTAATLDGSAVFCDLAFTGSMNYNFTNTSHLMVAVISAPVIPPPPIPIPVATFPVAVCGGSYGDFGVSVRNTGTNDITYYLAFTDSSGTVTKDATQTLEDGKASARRMGDFLACSSAQVGRLQVFSSGTPEVGGLAFTNSFALPVRPN